jgi:hypothetical protein
MDIEILKQMETQVHVLRVIIGDLEDSWDQHAHGCEYYKDDSTGLDCTHPDPGCDPVCVPGNCPLTKQ